MKIAFYSCNEQINVIVILDSPCICWTTGNLLCMDCLTGEVIQIDLHPCSMIRRIALAPPAKSSSTVQMHALDMLF
jgi:hypothetical protein